MSMIVTTIVPEGIVMAADSATTLYTFADMKNIFTGNYAEAVKNTNMGLVAQSHENVLSWSTASRYTNKINVMRKNNIAIIHGSSMGSGSEVQLNPYIETFCNSHDFEKPREAAEGLLKYLRKGFSDQNASFMVGGYNHIDGDIPYAESFMVELGQNEVIPMNQKGQYGILFASANSYFANFRELINNNAKNLSLQDAVDVTMWAFDVSMKAERFIDLKTIICSPIDVLTITQSGVQWIQRKKPEVK